MTFRLPGGLVVLLFAVLTGCATAPSPPEATPVPVVQLSSGLDAAGLRCFLGPETGLTGEERPWVVALLSPRMVYSLQAWPRMKSEAEALGFRVAAWRDPRIPEIEWRAALDTEALSRSNSVEVEALQEGCLAQWMPIDHVPLTRVLWRGHVHRWPVWGVMTSQAWEETLRNRLASLKGAVASAAPQ